MGRKCRITLRILQHFAARYNQALLELARNIRATIIAAMVFGTLFKNKESVSFLNIKTVLGPYTIKQGDTDYILRGADSEKTCTFFFPATGTMDPNGSAYFIYCGNEEFGINLQFDSGIKCTGPYTTPIKTIGTYYFIYRINATNFICTIVGSGSGTPGPQGPAGPQGPQGPEGKQGVQGIQGIQGIQGPAGPEGPQGPKGADGRSLQILGYYDTVQELQNAHPTGNPGDCYMVGKPGHLYTWNVDDRVWSDAGQLEGPQGPKGNDGPQGPQGIQGVQGPTGPQGEKGDRGPAGPPGPGGGSLVTVRFEKGSHTLDDTDVNVLFVADDGPLTILLPSTEEANLPVGTVVQIADMKAGDPATIARYAASFGGNVIAPLGTIAKASGQQIQATKINDTDWLVTGLVEIDPKPPVIRAITAIGGGTKYDGEAKGLVGGYLQANWTLNSMIGVIAQRLDVIDKDSGEVRASIDLGGGVTEWVSASEQFATWQNLILRLVVTDRDEREIQRVSGTFYVCGKPSMAKPNTLYYKCANDYLQCYPKLFADIQKQCQDKIGFMKATLEVKNPSKFGEWWASPVANDFIATLKCNYGEVFENGRQLDARFILENEFGRTVSYFKVTVGSDTPPTLNLEYDPNS